MLQIARKCPFPKASMANRIGFYSGMRLAEILRARVLDGKWVLDTTKNGEPRHLPIHHKAAQPARVFVKTKGARSTIQKWWRIARLDAKRAPRALP